MPPTSKKLRGHIGLILSDCPSIRSAFLRTQYLKNRLRYGMIFGIQYPYHMKMCGLTFRRNASNIARVTPLFVKIKYLLYLGNQFVFNLETLYKPYIYKYIYGKKQTHIFFIYLFIFFF